jgi:hypothetical protein
VPLGGVVDAADGGPAAGRAPDAGPGREGAHSLKAVEMRFCDDRGEHGFSWVVDEPSTRTSHALAARGRVWLVDPVRFEPAVERARDLGRPVAVLQLLDRHNRDCASVAEELVVPHLVVPDEVPDSPFVALAVRRTKRWRETALWWPDERTLVVAEAIGTNPFFTGGRNPAGVHLLLRLSPPRDVFRDLEPAHLLVCHGEGLHGPAAANGLRQALDTARTGLPRVALRVPALAVDAMRRRG